jgi:hypothetical protein
MSDEWLTITQAAARLGIGERQTRRYAAKLAPEDRREAGHDDGHKTGSRPAYVRLSAMRAQRGASAMASDTLDLNVKAPDMEADTTPDTRPAQAGHEAGHMTAALVAQLQAENVFLRGQVEQHARAEAELRAALREALRMSNRALMPAGDDVVQEAPPTSTAPTSTPEPKPARPLWMLLLGWRPGG